MKLFFYRANQALLALLLIGFVSCNGQQKKNQPVVQADEDLKVISEKESGTKPLQTSNNGLVDPLFPSNKTLDNTGMEFSYEGQLCHWVRNIFEDSKGQLWFGTNHYGVIRYDGESLEYFDEANGFGGGRVNTILEDSDGNVWFSTYGGLTKYDGSVFTNYSVQIGKIDNDLWDVHIDSKGLFWIATSEGVVQFDGEKFEPFPVPLAEVKAPNPILSPRRITAVLEDRHGKIWFGTDSQGITIYNPNGDTSFSHFTTEDGLADNNISALMEDRKGNIWIGTMFGGVSMYDGNAFTNYTQNGEITGVEVAQFFEDELGNIWFGVEHHGVYQYDGDSFTNFDEENGLLSGGIISILKDSKERFWFGGFKGLFRYTGERFVTVTDNGPWSR